jgi:hypothetical protein
VTVAQFLAASRAGPGSAIHSLSGGSLSDGSGGLTAPRLPSGCSSTVYDFPAAGVGQQSGGSKPERCVRFAVAKDQVRVSSTSLLLYFHNITLILYCSCHYNKSLSLYDYSVPLSLTSSQKRADCD